jgi:hypothetical protein
LSLFEPPRLAFAFLQCRDELGFRDRQVAVEYEALTVEAGGRKCEQDGRGPAQGHDADVPLVGEQYQACSGIGDGRESRLGKQAGVTTLQ